MSVLVSGLVWSNFPYGGGQLLTALALADKAGHDGSEVRPSIKLICEMTRQARSTVKRHIKQMVDEGYLELERASTPRLPAVYRFNLSLIQTQDIEGVQNEPSKSRGSTAMDPQGVHNSEPSGGSPDEPLTLITSITSINNNNSKSKRFKKPTIEELETYAAEIGFIGFDAQYFFDRYESNDWMVGKTRMKDWRATVRTWKRNAEKWGEKNGSDKSNYKQRKSAKQIAAEFVERAEA